MTIDKYLRVKQISEWTGLSRATIYALEKSSEFPKKIPLGARAVAWRESEIATWIEARKNAVNSGREAKPGRPPQSKRPVPKAFVVIPESAVEADLNSSAVAPQAPSSQGDAMPELADWSDYPLPSAEELANARAALIKNAQGLRRPKSSHIGKSQKAIDHVAEVKNSPKPTKLRGSTTVLLERPKKRDEE